MFTLCPETDPAVGNLDSDSNLEIAVGENRHVQAYLQSNAPQNAPWEGRIVLLNHDASLLCSYDDSGAMQDIYSSPVIADIDNDGTNDVLFGTRDGVLYVVYYSGSSTCSLKWKKDLGGTMWSSPAIADVDNDGKAEIIVKHDAIITSPSLMATAVSEFGVLRSGDEEVLFNPRTGKWYGTFNNPPERRVQDMMREATEGFFAMTGSSSTLSGVDNSNRAPVLGYIPNIRAIEGDIVDLGRNATDPDGAGL